MREDQEMAGHWRLICQPSWGQRASVGLTRIFFHVRACACVYVSDGTGGGQEEERAVMDRVVEINVHVKDSLPSILYPLTRFK